MYSEEIKYKIVHLLGYKTIKEIAEEFDISYSTLYRWQKSKKASELIKKLMLEEKYEEALVIGKDYPNNEVIKGQVMSIYMKKGNYEKAIKIAREFPNNAPIQGRLMSIHMGNQDYEEAIKIAEKFPNDAPIQSQLIKIYMENGKYEAVVEIAKKFPNNVLIKNRLMEKNKDYEKTIEIAKKFPNEADIQSRLIKIYMKNGDYENAIGVAKKFPNDNIIQSQLIKIYMENGEYEAVVEIAKKFPNDAQIQSQLMTVYMKNKDYEAAIKIAKKFSSYAPIQSQLMKICTENEIKENPEEISDWYNEIIKAKKQEFPIKILEIRNKIVVDNISVKDLDTLESFKEKLEEEKYLLIKLAIYEKLGLLNIGIKQLKQNTIFSDKLKKQLLMQFERKSKFYNLGNWDSLIGWFDETRPLEKIQKTYVKENGAASENLLASIPEVQSKNTESSKMQKTIPKKQNNPKSVFKTNIGVTNAVPSKVKEEKKKPTKIKNNQGPKTLYDTLDQTYKKMILNLKIKYYKDMHNEEKKQSALYKYDRLEEALSSKPDIKNFDILLLMLIGDGDNGLDIEQSIPKKYNDEYKKVLNKINSRRKH